MNGGEYLMKIKNLTPKMRGVRVVELVGGKAFTVYIQGNRSMDIPGVYIPDTKAYEGIIEVDNPFNSTPVEIEETQVGEEETTGEEVITSEDEVVQESTEKGEDDTPAGEDSQSAETLTDKFICQECGAEFASERSLKSHISRVHSK